jgi:hypothetical protein
MVRTHNGNWLSLEFNISVLGVGVMVFNATFNYISVIYRQIWLDNIIF